MKILEELQQVFRETFNDPSIVLNAETTAQDIDGWDSLSHVTLVLAAEKRFGVRFNATDISMMENVGQFVSLIQKLSDRA